MEEAVILVTSTTTMILVMVDSRTHRLAIGTLYISGTNLTHKEEATLGQEEPGLNIQDGSHNSSKNFEKGVERLPLRFLRLEDLECSLEIFCSFSMHAGLPAAILLTRRTLI